MIWKLFILLTAVAISSASAEEWSAKIGKNPGNRPIKNTAKISPKLDFIAFTTDIDKKPHLTVRVRNGKHKQGPSSISIPLENSTIVVQRIDISKPMSKIENQKDGEYLMDTFISGEKSYGIFYKVSGGKLDPSIVVRSK